MARLLIAAALLVLVVGCGESFDTKKIDDTLDTLNKHGVVYSGTLEGPTEAGFELFSGGRATTGGWLSIRLQSPIENPLGENPADYSDGAGEGEVTNVE